MRMAVQSDGVLVMGSSVMVYSAYRLVKAAKEAGARLAIVNVGTTRADSLADLKVWSFYPTEKAQLVLHLSAGQELKDLFETIASIV